MGIWNFREGGTGEGGGGIWEKIADIDLEASEGGHTVEIDKLYDKLDLQLYGIIANAGTLGISINYPDYTDFNGKYAYRRWTVGTTGSVTVTDGDAWGIFSQSGNTVGDKFLVHVQLSQRNGALNTPLIFSRVNRANRGQQYQDLVGAITNDELETDYAVRFSWGDREMSWTGILAGLVIE